jgi:protein TonB
MIAPRMRRLSESSGDFSTRAYRGAVACAILAAHGVLAYAAVSLGPVIRKVSEAPITARFVELREPEQRWTPPSVHTPISVPIEVAMPIVPQVEVELPVVPPATPRQITAQAPASPPPARAEANAPKWISAVEYVREPVPRYPPQSRRLKEQGLVVLRVLIDERGQACSIEVETSSGHARLDHAAKEAVARAAFRPYVEDGEPRRALVLIPIEFSLSSSRA